MRYLMCFFVVGLFIGYMLRPAFTASSRPAPSASLTLPETVRIRYPVTIAEPQTIAPSPDGRPVVCGVLEQP